MFLSRACGDALLLRFTERGVITAAGVLLPVVILTGTMLHTPTAMGLSLVVLGVLIGPLFPVAISRASRVDPAHAASMAAKVSVAGYTAYLAGPPLIGLVAELVPLPLTFTLVVVSSALGLCATARNGRGSS
ncbi:hypothetical protein DSY14_05645 [Nocardiopsis sp. MG754419]|nr:hypothetical protein [Nocardiopsis sp. MG754419]